MPKLRKQLREKEIVGYLVTIPKKLVEELEWESQDYIDIKKDNNGSLVLNNLSKMKREK